jgi:hypothetical protein
MRWRWRNSACLARAITLKECITKDVVERHATEPGPAHWTPASAAPHRLPDQLGTWRLKARPDRCFPGATIGAPPVRLGKASPRKSLGRPSKPCTEAKPCRPDGRAGKGALRSQAAQSGAKFGASIGTGCRQVPVQSNICSRAYPQPGTVRDRAHRVHAGRSPDECFRLDTRPATIGAAWNVSAVAPAFAQDRPSKSR